MKRIDVAIAVIVRSGQILICQRKKNDTFGGFWEFPGGKCEAGEKVEDCLVRELREELDIGIAVGAKLTAIRHDYPQAQLTLHPFLCELKGAEPKLIECQQLAWVAPGELSRYKFPPANQSLLEEVSRRVISSAPPPTMPPMRDDAP
jgi:mutator protein MutT